MSPTIDPKAELLRPAKFARLIDMSRSKVYEMLSAGEIRAVTIGGVLRIPIDEIDRFKAQAATE
jgi:excisionase family DNA binding protein